MLEITLIVIILALAWMLVNQSRRHTAEGSQQQSRSREAKKEVLRERDQLLDALGDAFLLVSETSQIVFANECARKLVKGRRLQGRSIMEAFLDDALSVAIMKCIRTGKPMQERVVLHSTYTPLGSVGEQGLSAWVIDAAPLASYSEQGLTRVVIRDVTTEHQADQVRRDFVANASHELRTPMAIINGYLENLLDDDLLDDPVMSRRFLETMRKHGQRISLLVEDMLVISKMESGDAMLLNMDSFSIKECVNDVCDRLEAMISQQQAVVDISVVPDDLCMMGDRFYWTQVIFNLMENALKQNPQGPLRLVVQAEKSEDQIKISICDNGVGIPAADLPYIFKRFYRVEKHHSQSEIKGTGLGLSIVRRAIEAHGGKITASSIPGQQTCFVISLPVE
ncbi:cell wall metabolism sensor histidine kinase WalK [Akkermansiaceae bacterium]|nr:cell wall metabolism sensor histidine kinase WalK [Akkermansiaceae bacterium]